MTDQYTKEFLELDASTVLKSVAEKNPKHVFIISWPENGSSSTYHTTTTDVQAVIMRINEFMEKFYHEISIDD